MGAQGSGRPESPFSYGQDMTVELHAEIEAWKGNELRRERDELVKIQAILDQHYNATMAQTFLMADKFHEMARQIGVSFQAAEVRARTDRRTLATTLEQEARA
jgi:hypothetical protein